MADLQNEYACVAEDWNAPKLYHVRIVRLGFAQLVIGVLVLCLGVFDVASTSVAFDLFSVGRSVTGIWVGLVMTIAGSIGLVTSRSELRRRTAILTFTGLSVLCFLVSVILMAIEISEIATASYIEGQIDLRKSGNTTAPCVNISGTPTNVSSTVQQQPQRCVSRSTLDVKFVVGGILIAFGFFDAMVALCSVIAARDIFLHKYNPRHGQQTIDMRPTDISRVTVSDYFEQRLQTSQPNSVSHQVSNDVRSNHEPPGNHRASTDFPDSDQFRSHLEVLDGNH